MRRLPLGGFVKQVGWSFVARVTSALLQLVVVVLLARGLDPESFAHVMSASVMMLAVVPLNGFGLVRQIQYRRSVDPDDPTLPAVFALWQRFSVSSAVLWLVGCLVLWVLTGSDLFIKLTPIAVWLQFEQLTTLWNAVSIVDDRAHDLMSSYVCRRGPVGGRARRGARGRGWTSSGPGRSHSPAVPSWRTSSGSARPSPGAAGSCRVVALTGT